MWQGIVLCAGLTLGGFALTHLPARTHLVMALHAWKYVLLLPLP